MHQFFVPHITGDSLIALTEDEARHFFVLRLTDKDIVQITDGKGIQCTAKVKKISKKQVDLEILEKKVFQPPAQKTFIAIAPTKGNDRFEWFLEKAVELGVSGIYPFYANFSERKKINLQRLQKIAVAALKQSLGVFLPEINPIQSFRQVLTLLEKHNGHFFMAYCNDKSIPQLKDKPIGGDAYIIIGPEGGFSTEEYDMAKTLGWKPVLLGENRLRTETAGLVALTTLKILQQ